MWKEGNYQAYKWQAKVFDEPSKWGIGGGRISKLWISKNGECVFNYDRGLDVSECPASVLMGVLEVSLQA